MSLQPVYIAGSSLGLVTDKKPFLIPDQAFSELNNAYVWRDRVKKREGLELLGRLKRTLTGQNLGNTDGAGNFSGNIISILGLEATSSIEEGSLQVTVGAQVFTEPVVPDGTLSNGGAGTGTINYATGDLTIDTDPNLAANPVLIDFNYFPGLSVMGIWQREIANLNEEQTIFFDTTYAYIFLAGSFQEFIPGTTWSGGDADFFWATNYRGSVAQDRLFFTTNFVVNAANPIRYTDGVTWTPLIPLITATDNLYQARILIPYYGRLLALNTYEGTTAGGFAGAVNYFNRCRFSQIGSPIAVDAWRSDLFGKGGFIDAPTNESIISATFYKNTLIVGFERSTWQLRYVGEYGLPFLWERISSDFGTESTFSPVLFDQGVASVGDRAIISATSENVQRIDNQIPDIVFEFRNLQNGLERVHGIRDYRKELVFWCYSDGNLNKKFPTNTLVYNYKNNTFAIFRNNVTCFGIFQPLDDVTWDSQVVTWDDNVTWDDVEDEGGFERIVSGNQQGYVHYYGYTEFDDPSLYISAIDFTVTPIRLTIINHNLIQGDIIYITGILNADGSPNPLNDNFFYVVEDDVDHIFIMQWNFTSQMYEDVSALNPPPTYIGGGQIALIPRLSVITKDFNPMQQAFKQFKLSYVDFLMDRNANSMSVLLYVNSSLSVQANVLTGNSVVQTDSIPPFNLPATDYNWQRLFATSTGQFLRIEITYDDNLMNTLSTHENDWIMNAICLWTRPGGRNVIQ